jgi:Family of unknown function (DUF6494)
MNEDVFNMSVRKFLKEFGITAQREVENTIREALSKGGLTGKPSHLRRSPTTGSDQGPVRLWPRGLGPARTTDRLQGHHAAHEGLEPARSVPVHEMPAPATGAFLGCQVAGLKSPVNDGGCKSDRIALLLCSKVQDDPSEVRIA